MKKYYEVIAKCGHVGKNHYYEGSFFEIAENGREAAFIVRGRGRVKHDHKDAILSVREITREEYILGNEKKAFNPYFNCSNIQEQTMALELIAYGIKDENDSEIMEKDEYQQKRKNSISYKQNKFKQKMKSFIDYNEYEAYAM